MHQIPVIAILILASLSFPTKAMSIAHDRQRSDSTIMLHENDIFRFLSFNGINLKKHWNAIKNKVSQYNSTMNKRALWTELHEEVAQLRTKVINSFDHHAQIYAPGLLCYSDGKDERQALRRALGLIRYLPALEQDSAFYFDYHTIVSMIGAHVAKAFTVNRLVACRAGQCWLKQRDIAAHLPRVILRLDKTKYEVGPIKREHYGTLLDLVNGLHKLEQ